MKGFIQNKIKYDELLNSLKPFLQGKEAYLAGGYIRDAYFKKNTPDRDIVLFNVDVRELAKDVAETLNGSFVELDFENQIYRVVFKEDFIDFAKGINNSVEDDVKRRDFTINSIFYDLNKAEFIDLTGGFEDLAGENIKTCNIKNLSDDPLRMLRAFRFASVLDFKIDIEVKDFIKNNPKIIHNIAAERINAEVIKMFEGDFVAKYLLEMHECEFLEEIFPFISKVKKIPSNSHHHLDLLHHSVETVKHIRIKKPLLKIAAFMHDIGKPDTWKIEEDTGRHRFIGHEEYGSAVVKPMLSKLKFSKKQIEYISKMIKYHIYPSALMCEPDVTKKAMARFVRKLAPDGTDVIELARADRLSARGPMVSDEIVQRNLNNLEALLKYYNDASLILAALPKLLDGKEIMELLNIQGGPVLGQIIDELKEAQLEGLVKNRDDAVRFVLNKNA